MQTARVMAALAISLAAAAPASAATVWTVEGVFAPRQQVPSLVASDVGRQAAVAANGGELSGMFVTEEDENGMRVLEVNLTTSAYGAFQSFTYDDNEMIDDDRLPQYFRLTVPVGGMTYQLQLQFDPGLGSNPGKTFAFSGWEHQEFPGSGNRMLTGFATANEVSAAPEPGAWALMVAGFGLAGAALRRRSSPLRA